MERETYQFGRYHLDKRIGAGAMSEVYRGRLIGALGFEKDVAIKLIHPHAAED